MENEMKEGGYQEQQVLAARKREEKKRTERQGRGFFVFICNWKMKEEN